MSHNRTTTGHLATFVIILIWGTTFISTKVLLRTFSPVEILFIRFIAGYLVLQLTCPRSLRLTSARQEGLYAAAGFCGVTVYYLLENIAFTYTLASNVSVIISIAPLFTAILGWVSLEGEGPRFRFFAGFLLTMAGISLVSFGNGAALSLNPTEDLLAVATVAMWIVYSALTKKISVLDYGTIQSTKRTFFYGILLAVPALAFVDFYATPVQFTDMKDILSLLFLGLGVLVLYFVTWNTGVKILGPIKTDVYIYIVPVITALTSALILKEPATIPTTLGIIMTPTELFLSKQKITKKGEPKIRTTKMKSV